MDTNVVEAYVSYQKQIENFLAIRSQLTESQVKEAEALLTAQKKTLGLNEEAQTLESPKVTNPDSQDDRTEPESSPNTEPRQGEAGEDSSETPATN